MNSVYSTIYKYVIDKCKKGLYTFQKNVQSTALNRFTDLRLQIYTVTTLTCMYINSHSSIIAGCSSVQEILLRYRSSVDEVRTLNIAFFILFVIHFITFVILLK